MASGTAEFIPFCEITFVDPPLTKSEKEKGAKRVIREPFILSSDEFGNAIPGPTGPIAPQGPFDFKVVVSGDVKNPSTAVVTLYNLNRETIARMVRGQLIYIKMGFRDGESANVFAGIIWWFYPDTLDGADVISELHCRDISSIAYHTSVNASYQNKTIEYIARDLIRRAGFVPGTIEETKYKVPRFTAGGKNRNLGKELKDLAILAVTSVKPKRGWATTFRGGRINFISNQTSFWSTTVLDSDHGLKKAEPSMDDVDNPADGLVPLQQLDNDGKTFGDPASAYPYGVTKRKGTFESTLKPLLTSGSIAFFKSFRLNGFYAVTNYQHVFDANGESGTSGDVAPADNLDKAVNAPAGVNSKNPLESFQ